MGTGWQPKLVLAITNNEDLSLSTPSPALEERMALIDPPWRTIPAEERSLDVWAAANRGSAECTRWLVDGAVEWRRRRSAGSGSALLPQTAKMAADVREWAAGADEVSRFVMETCEITEARDTLSRVLHQRYRRWHQSQDLRGNPIGQKEFLTRLVRIRGVVLLRNAKVRAWNLIERDPGERAGEEAH